MSPLPMSNRTPCPLWLQINPYFLFKDFQFLMTLLHWDTGLSFSSRQKLPHVNHFLMGFLPDVSTETLLSRVLLLTGLEAAHLWSTLPPLSHVCLSCAAAYFSLSFWCRVILAVQLARGHTSNCGGSVHLVTQSIKTILSLQHMGQILLWVTGC